MSGTQYRAVRVGGCLQTQVEQRPDGSVLLRSTEALGEYPARLTDRLEHWAAVVPDRSFVARRDPAMATGSASPKRRGWAARWAWARRWRSLGCRRSGRS